MVWSRKVKTVSSQNWYITDAAYLYWIPIQYLHVCRLPHLHNTVRYCSTLWTPTSKTRNYTCAITNYIVLKVTDSLTGSNSCVILYHILHFNCLCQFLYHFSTQKLYQDKFFKILVTGMSCSRRWLIEYWKRYHVRFGLHHYHVITQHHTQNIAHTIMITHHTEFHILHYKTFC